MQWMIKNMSTQALIKALEHMGESLDHLRAQNRKSAARMAQRLAQDADEVLAEIMARGA